MSRIYLSPPDTGLADQAAINRAFEGGWIAPLGPEVDAFEAELASVTNRSHGVALSSGTAALHLALLLLGVGEGDRVLVSSLTFSATLNAIRYVGARPVLIDSTPESWNMDPDLLAEALESTAEYAVCIPVDIYGQCADYTAIVPLLAKHGVPLVSDAAEALGATHKGEPAGSFGAMAALSFNGNKIITTSGGGAMVTDDAEWADKARWLSTQARDPAPHYQHSSIGYNYRLSNLLAALGRSQLSDLKRRVDIRRAHNIVLPGGPRRSSGSRVHARGSRQPVHLLAHHIHHRSRRRRGRPGGGAAPSRVARHRGEAGMEADAPPTGASPIARYSGAPSRHGSSSTVCASPVAHR